MRKGDGFPMTDEHTPGFQRPRLVLVAMLMIALVTAFLQTFAASGSKQLASGENAGETALHKAARAGDVSLIQSQLRAGMDANVRDQAGRTPLMYAVEHGQLGAVRALLAAGADVNARSRTGRTALLEAAAHGRLQSARLLVAAGADLNAIERGWGSALETAERAGHNDVAAMLRKAEARSSGRSVGDKVCVRPWEGDGYCGTVQVVNKTAYRIHVTEIVGCKQGCAPRAECSAGRPVGGAGGIAVGDEVDTVSWCLTHTGVKP